MMMYLLAQVLILSILWLLRERILIIWNLFSLSQLRLKKLKWERALNCLITDDKLQENIELPPFKFYDSLCSKLIGFSKSYGSEVRGHFSFIREQITLDFQFQSRVLGAFWRVQAEFFIMCMLTWGFHFAILHYLELQDSGHAWIILSLESLGFVTFLLSFYFLAIKSLKIYDQYFKSLIFLKSLIGVHLPFQQVCELSGVNHILESERKIPDIYEGVSSLVTQILSRGHRGVHDKLDLLIAELHYRQKNQFDSVQRKILISKMILILFLFFPAYLLNIWEIIGNMSF